MKPVAFATSALFLAACIDPNLSDRPPSPTPYPTPAPTEFVPVPTPEFDFVNTWPDGRTSITKCVNTGRSGKNKNLGTVGMVSLVSGTITNTEGQSEDYIIAFYAETNQGQGTNLVQVVRVAPGATANWTGTAITVNSYPGKSTQCGVLSLNAVPS